MASTCDLRVSANDVMLPIASAAQYMVEDSANLTHEQVFEGFSDMEWSRGNTLNFGYSNAIYWVYVCLENSEDYPISRLLELDYPVLDYIHINEYRDGALSKSVKLGDKYPFKERVVDHPNFLLPLDFDANERKQLLLRVETSSSVQIPAVLWEKEAKLSEDVQIMVGRGLYYGAMLIMACYNLLIFFAIRDKNYAYYVGYVISMAALSSGIHGINFQYLWPYATWWNDMSLVVSLGGVVIFAALFTRSFLNTDVRPNLSKGLMIVAWGGGVCIAISLFLPYQYAILLTIIWAIVGILNSFTAGLIRWKDGNELAKFYNLAWGFMLLGGFILAMNKFGVLPRNVFTENAARLGSALEVMLLSLALGHRMNIDRRLREEAQKESIKAQVSAVESLRQYQKLYDNSAQGLFVLDKSGQILQANPSFCKLIQANVIEGASNNPNICRYFEAVDKALSGELRDEFREGFRSKGVRSNKSECWAVISLTPSVDHLGEVEYFEGAALDITSSIEKEEAERKRQTAEAAAHAKSTFLANMSHEIRTPMNGVLGIAELMKGTELDSLQQKYLSTIHSSGLALLDIINDILDYSKIEENKLDVERITINLLQIIDECVSVFSFRSNEKGLSLYVDFDPRITREIKSDPLRIRQIILNLLSNAVKFTDSGHVLIKVDKDPDHLVRIAIVDTGVGMNQEQQEKLFKSFSQAESSTSRKYGGTGLGLAISKRLAELMGGSIGVNSELGKGAEFWFKVRDYSENSVPCYSDARKKLPTFGIVFVLTDMFFVESTARFMRSLVDDVEVIHGVDILVDRIEKEGIPEINRLIIDEEIMGQLPAGFVEKYPDVFASTLLLCTSGDANRYKSAISLDRILEKPVSTGQLYSALYSTFHKGVGLEGTNAIDADFSGFTFLVAEDNLVNQMVIKGILKKYNAEVVLAADGNETVDLYKTYRGGITAILMDIEMPDCDGYQATQLIRDFESGADYEKVPILGLSAHAMTEFSERALSIGMDGFVSKPIAIADLIEALRELGLQC